MASRYSTTDEIKTTNSIHIRRAFAYIVLILISIMCLFWFYVLFINATRSNGELGRGFTVVPSTYLYKNLYNVLHDTIPVGRGLANSFLVASLTALLSVYFSTMTAYAIQVYDFKFRNAIFTFILVIMMIPTQVSALGFVNLIRSMKLIDHSVYLMNFVPLVVPSIAAPITFFYLKQYMASNLPMSLIEAARIDGESEFGIFNKIAVPLMKPAIAVQAIFAFVSSWNNYFIPSLVLHDDRYKTLPILIAQLRTADWSKFDMGKVYAMIAFSIFPVIVVYLLLSRYIVGGVTAGGVKE